MTAAVTATGLLAVTKHLSVHRIAIRTYAPYETFGIYKMANGFVHCIRISVGNIVILKSSSSVHVESQKHKLLSIHITLLLSCII